MRIGSLVLVALLSFALATSIGLAEEPLSAPPSPGECVANPPPHSSADPTRPTPAEGQGVCPFAGGGTPTPPPQFSTPTPTLSPGENTPTPVGPPPIEGG
jgi:hypothetical protein